MHLKFAPMEQENGTVMTKCQNILNKTCNLYEIYDIMNIAICGKRCQMDLRLKSTFAEILSIYKVGRKPMYIERDL